MRKRLFFALAALLVSACSGGGNSGPSMPARPTSTPAAATPSPSPGPTLPAAAPSSLPTTLYAANFANPSVTIYDAGTSGNATPSATLAGSNTTFAGPFGVALDSHDLIYVSDFGAGTGNVDVFAAGAAGNVAPIRTIQGVGYQNGGTNNGLAVDPAGNIYVVSANLSNPAVKVYGPSQSGNVPPLRSLAGAASGIALPYEPQGLALDASLNTYVSLSIPQPGGGSSGIVNVYAPGANGDPAPIRSISGSNTGIISPQGMAVDALGYLYVTDSVDNAVLIFAPGANGNVAPSRVIAASTQLQQPDCIVLDRSNNLYVNELFTFSVTAFSANSNGLGIVLFSLGGGQTGLSARSIAFAN